ncbi:MAG: HEAT repeat domain-containing protein [Desulfobacteraceae bacterium]|nr:HEAT repeat domain-containing protein [Desulfobacteraceae bacterium]
MPTRRGQNEDAFQEIQKSHYTSLTERRWPEADLQVLAGKIAREPNAERLMKSLICQIPLLDEDYDWNVGSLIQHWDPVVVSNILPKIQQVELLNSIGMTWGLGQLKSTARNIVDFLREAVKSSENSDAWWRAAYSLEVLGLELAVDYLKANLRNRHIYSYDYCLKHFSDRRAIIGLLLIIDSTNLPFLIKDIERFFVGSGRAEKLNAAWLVGRLRLEDPKLMVYMREQLESPDYEISYYTLLTLRELASEQFRGYFENVLCVHDDPLYRSVSAHALASIANSDSIPILKQSLLTEESDRVRGSITKAIDTILTACESELVVLKKTSDWHENGMIKDEADKWYANPEMYHIFSESQDPNNICFEIVRSVLKNHEVVNPVDLGTGTGRLAWQIMDNVPFTGHLFCVDKSKEMIRFLSRRVRRQVRASSIMKPQWSSIDEFPRERPDIESSLVVSSFGFPSRVFNPEVALKELKAISELLTDKGLLITIGWDETFNDELSEMWYKFVPDALYADNFEDWRRKRADRIKTPRNCGLNWYARRIVVPLRFRSIAQAAEVVGHLFGRSAAEWIIRTNKLSWQISMGITVDSGAAIKARLSSKTNDSHL